VQCLDRLRAIVVMDLGDWLRKLGLDRRAGCRVCSTAYCSPFNARADVAETPCQVWGHAPLAVGLMRRH
jgi:hypothetical protein